MTALRTAAQQALEALKVATTPLAKDRQEVLRAQDNLRAALAQQDAPVQEPVAWRLWDEDPQGGGDWRYYDAKDFKEGIDPMKYFDGLVPLYTTPPQRKPLTEEEIDAEWRELDGEVSTMFMRVLRKFARAIERAHGIVTCGDTKERA